MATAAEARKAKQQREAGLASSTAIKAPALSVNPSQELGPYKPDEIITTPEHLARYLALLVEDNKDKEDKSPIPDSKQLLEAFGQIDQTQEPEDRDIAFLDYVSTLKSTKYEPLTDEQRKALRNSSQEWAYAEQCGQRATDALEQAVESSIEGKKLWDGGPLVIEQELVKIYGDDMTGWPIIGSRKTGKLNRNLESTDTVPEGFNGPTDYFMADKGKGELEVVRWLTGFVEAMPHVSRLITQRNTGQAILKGTQLAIIPDIYTAYVPTKTNGLTAVITHKVEAVIAELSGDITKHVNRIGLAISYYQAKTLIKEHLNDSVRFKLVAGTAEASRKKTKPIQMMGYSPEVDWFESGKPTPLSQFIRFGKNAEKCKAAGGTLLSLYEISKAKKTPKPVQGPGAGTKAEANKIENVDQFLNNLDVVKDYAQHHEGMIKERCAAQRNGAEFCYALVSTYNALESIFADPETEKLIRKRAMLYNNEALAATAAADAAEAAAKKAKAA